MKKLALSSEIYLIKASELKRLSQDNSLISAAKGVKSSEIIVLLNTGTPDVLLSGAKRIGEAADGDFLPVRFAYRSYPAWQAFFINLIKPVKRKFYSVFRQPIRRLWLACLPTTLPAASATNRTPTSGQTKNGR